VLPLAVVSSLWLLAAIARGVIGGTVASTVASVDPAYAFRIGTWIVATIFWVPVFVYTVAQFDRRRLLLGALDAARHELETARCVSAESADDVQRRLRESVRQTLQPVLDDLQGSVTNSRESLSHHRLEELSARLRSVHDEVAAVVEAAGGGASLGSRSVERASVRRAFDVPPGRPVLAAALVTIATIALIAPDAWRVFGHLAAIEVVVATTVAGIFVGLGPAVALSTSNRVTAFPGQTVTVVSLILALGAMAQIMLASEIDPITSHGLLIAPLIALSLVIASVVFALAFALSSINEDADALLAETRDAIEELTVEHRELQNRERRRLAILLHGPIQGRLAACVMALNFHTTGSTGLAEDERATAMLDSVLTHLNDVSDDLVALASLEELGGATTPEGG
jgi:hypothetical protein